MKRDVKIAVLNGAADYLRMGFNPDDINDSHLIKAKDIARAMKRIIANAVILKLFDINQRIVLAIDGGMFRISTGEIEDLSVDFAACISAIESYGNDWGNNITKEELETAIAYTLYEEDETLMEE